MGNESLGCIEVAVTKQETPEESKKKKAIKKRDAGSASISDLIEHWLTSDSTIPWAEMDRIMQAVCRLPLEHFYVLCKQHCFLAYPNHRRTLSNLYLQFRRHLEAQRLERHAA